MDNINIDFSEENEKVRFEDLSRGQPFIDSEGDLCFKFNNYDNPNSAYVDRLGIESTNFSGEDLVTPVKLDIKVRKE